MRSLSDTVPGQQDDNGWAKIIGMNNQDLKGRCYEHVTISGFTPFFMHNSIYCIVLDLLYIEGLTLEY